MRLPRRVARYAGALACPPAQAFLLPASLARVGWPGSGVRRTWRISIFTLAWINRALCDRDHCVSGTIRRLLAPLTILHERQERISRDRIQERSTSVQFGGIGSERGDSWR